MATRRSRATPRPAAATALLVVDMVNALDFPEGARLLRHALPAARRVARLRARLKQRGVPTIFVNDNFTHWRDDFRQLVAICSQPGATGAPLLEALPPEQDDYSILKPQHSAFYNTPLEVLLQQLGIGRVVLTGINTDQCIIASALDARMRRLDTVVASDGTASITPERHRNALAVMREMDVDVRTCGRIEP
jgi:nicotinamidase-related amidase